MVENKNNGDKRNVTASFQKLDAYSEISPVVTVNTLAALRVVCAGGEGARVALNSSS